MQKILFFALVILWAAPIANSFADDGKRSSNVGEATQQWLEFQRGGEAASQTQRPLSDEMARRGYQRYVDTYSYKIPESFANEDQSFIQD